MRRPVRATAGWLGGRLVLLLIIIAALVATDAYRDEFALLGAHVKGLLPDAELVQRLEAGRARMVDVARARTERTIRELETTPSRSAAGIDARIEALEDEIADRTAQRRGSVQRTIALLNGDGFQGDIENEIEIQLLTAERDALRRFKERLPLHASTGDAAREFVQARERTLKTWNVYRTKRTALQDYESANAIAIWVPGSEAWRRSTTLRRDLNRAAGAYAAAGREFYATRERWRKARAASREVIAQIEAAGTAPLAPLDELIATRRAAMDAASQQADRLKHSIQRVFVDAIVILVLVTLAPVGIKAFWYWIVAPLAARRPPIRLQGPATEEPRGPASAFESPPDAEPRPYGEAVPSAAKVSALSQELRIGDDEELLVHPDFLQSSTDRGRKDTRWLLSWTYPFTSIAAGMVVLTRIRATAGDPLVVSSTTDPFSEVGVIGLPEHGSLVLQPRSLVGVVQPVGRPIRIRPRWLFGLSALITLQFRYLIFDGPGQLIVQGRRGIRIEPAGRGRGIDQRATLGFTPNLDYSPRRSETFGAYLMGLRGLFNDNFSGGPGFYVYEEMPNFGRRSAITGRGLEGLTDGLLKVLGI